MDLTLIHQAPGAAPLPPGARVWRTCLREIAFLDQGEWGADGVPLTGAHAYKLLVEIVSGLRSPIVGETEVQAQFKAFLASLGAADTMLQRIGQRVLADVKHIRQHHLQGFGARSYGYLVARHIPHGVKAVIAGTGTLAAEIALHIGHASSIDQWGRTLPVTPSAPRHTFHAIGHPPAPCLDPSVLVIAAPFCQSDIEIVIETYPALGRVIDLRARDERGMLFSRVPVMTLDDLFAEASVSTADASRVSAALGEARRLAELFARREELRPFGWDDLCA